MQSIEGRRVAPAVVSIACVEDGKTTPSWKVKLASFVFVALFVVIGLEIVAHAIFIRRRGWSFLSVDTDNRVRVDPLVGWTYTPGYVGEQFYGPNQHLHINAQGFRGLRDVAVEKAPDRYRIICVGDSFTFGAGVGDEEGWCPMLEKIDPRIEAVNMGVGAAGVDQSVLWYGRDGEPLEHDLAIFAFIDSDFRRMIPDARNVINPKPRFRIVDGALKLTNVPVPDYGQYHRHDGLFFTKLVAFPRSLRSYQLVRDALDTVFVRKHYDPFAVADLLFADVAKKLDAKHRRGVLVYLAGSGDVEASCTSSGTGFCERKDRPADAVRFEQTAERAGLPFVDTTPLFHDLYDGNLAEYYLADGHYDVKGHDQVARYLYAKLGEVVEGFPTQTATTTD